MLFLLNIARKSVAYWLSLGVFCTTRLTRMSTQKSLPARPARADTGSR